MIGFALALFSFLAITTMINEIAIKISTRYLYNNHIPYRELLIIGVCIVVFVLMLLFNICIKRKWLVVLVNIIAVIALCNPITLIVSLFGIPLNVNYYTIENEAAFNQCADDMGTDFSNFPMYNEFNEQNVRFVGKVFAGFFFYQSITAIVKYDNPELCEADYKAYKKELKAKGYREWTARRGKATIFAKLMRFDEKNNYVYLKEPGGKVTKTRLESFCKEDITYLDSISQDSSTR